MCKPTAPAASESRPELDCLGPALKPEDLDREELDEVNPLDQHQTHHGVIRKIMVEKQYGFIRTEDGSDLFFMLNEVVDPWVVAIGDHVTYHVNDDNTHTGKSRAIRVMPSFLARPSCHSPGGSVLRPTNAIRSSMVRMTTSEKPSPSVKSTEEWESQVKAATNKFQRYLVEYASMDEDEALEFGEIKIAKAMQTEDLLKLPKHLEQIVIAKRGLEQSNKMAAQIPTSDPDIEFSDSLLDRAEKCLRLSQCMNEPPLEEKSEEKSTETEEDAQNCARAVIAPARMAKSNRFNHGEQHSGKVAQIVRGKFGFIVATTNASPTKKAQTGDREELKQKVFFHLNDAPEDMAVGDLVTFMVQVDPYNSDKTIAKAISVVESAAEEAFVHEGSKPSYQQTLHQPHSQSHQPQQKRYNNFRGAGHRADNSPSNGHSKHFQSGNANCNQDTAPHKAPVDGNWRRGALRGLDILHSGGAQQASHGGGSAKERPHQEFQSRRDRERRRDRAGNRDMKRPDRAAGMEAEGTSKGLSGTRAAHARNYNNPRPRGDYRSAGAK